MVILDFLLFLIIGVCIAYCWILNRRIQDLQNSRIEFARMIKELNISIIKAEASVSELKELSSNVGNKLKNSIEIAKDTTTSLTSASNIAINLMEKLKTSTQSEHHRDLNYSINEEKVDNEELKKSKRFNDDDFAKEPLVDSPKVNYKDHLKTFFTNIVTKDTESNVNLNQVSYYNTLRKIKPKK